LGEIVRHTVRGTLKFAAGQGVLAAHHRSPIRHLCSKIGETMGKRDHDHCAIVASRSGRSRGELSGVADDVDDHVALAVGQEAHVAVVEWHDRGVRDGGTGVKVDVRVARPLGRVV